MQINFQIYLKRFLLLLWLALLRHSCMMDGEIDDTVSAVLKFLAVINSVYTGLFLMPFLVLNDMFSFLPMTFFYPKD